MNKLTSWKDMQKGGIYNLVYTGSMQAYARINGKRTVRVTDKTDTSIKTIPLFCQFGDPYTDRIEGLEGDSRDPARHYADNEIYEPENESQWFRHSIMLRSMAEAVEQKLITPEDITEMTNWSGRCPFMPKINCGPGTHVLGVQARFGVEDKTEHPLLQTVFILWPEWQTLKDDFRKFGHEVRT